MTAILEQQRLHLPHHGELSDPARRNAELSGDQQWVAALPTLVQTAERKWSITVGAPYAFATEAYVARARQADGTPVVLKLVPPSASQRRGPSSTTADQVTALRACQGRGCVELLRYDQDSGAMLLERLGPSLADRQLPQPIRMRILAATAEKFWRPARPCHALPTGAEKAVDLAHYIRRAWAALGRPCAAHTVDHAMAVAQRRALAHDDDHAVLVHGDVHQWNALTSGSGYRLVDPHGLIAEPEYDLGVIMREEPLELIRGNPHARAAELAALTGCNQVAIRKWGVLQRVATGLLCTSLGMAGGTRMLAAADEISGKYC